MAALKQPNEDTKVPEFISRFGIPFAVGNGDHLKAIAYLGLPDERRRFVPWLNVIDKEMRIRHQFTGVDQEFFAEETHLANLRAIIDPLLGIAPTAPVKKAAPKKT